jgi:hypothetical protein
MSIKPYCLLLMKSDRRWSEHLVRKLEVLFNVIIVEALPVIKEVGFRGLSAKINTLILQDKIKVVFFSVDCFYGADLRFILGISSGVKKVLLTFDDITLHEFNSITAAGCDLVLTADPISVLKYREKGVLSEYCALESSSLVYRKLVRAKSIDILFFGNTELADRTEQIEFLADKGLNVEVVGGKDRFIESKELVEKICESKIVVNFSKTGRIDNNSFGSSVHRHYRQLKGRIIESGLCGTPCVSEYSPGIRLLFSDDEVPIFSNKEECFQLVSHYLSNEVERQRVADNLYRKSLREYEDVPLMKRMELALALDPVDPSANNANDCMSVVPFWYHRLTFRSRIQQLRGQYLEQCREIEVIRTTKNIAIRAKAGLILDILAWIVYDLLFSFRRTHR